MGIPAELISKANRYHGGTNQPGDRRDADHGHEHDELPTARNPCTADGMPVQRMVKYAKVLASARVEPYCWSTAGADYAAYAPAQSARHLVSGGDRGATNRGRERSNRSTFRCGPGSLHGFSSPRRRRLSPPPLWIRDALCGLKASERQARTQGLRPEVARHGRLPELRIHQAKPLFDK